MKNFKTKAATFAAPFTKYKQLQKTLYSLCSLRETANEHILKQL